MRTIQGMSKSKAVITALLIVGLLYGDLSRASSSTNAPPAKDGKPQAILPCESVIAILVVTVGVIMVVRLVIFCMEHPMPYYPPVTPTNPPPPVPPPVPPTTPPPKTNHIVVPPINPVTGPFYPTNAYSPPPPPGGGGTDTNGGPAQILPAYYWSPPFTTNSGDITRNLDSNNVVAWDITRFGYLDTNGPSPVVISSYHIMKLWPVQSSDDMKNWTNYTLTAWGSTNGVECVLTDGAGMGVFTNYTVGAMNNTVTIPFGVWVDPARPKNFVRLVP